MPSVRAGGDEERLAGLEEGLVIWGEERGEEGTRRGLTATARRQMVHSEVLREAESASRLGKARFLRRRWAPILWRSLEMG